MNNEPTRIKEILDEKSDILIKQSDPTEKVTLEKKTGPGGHREGAGRPKGSLNKRTMTALEAKNRFIERVHRHTDELFDAQLDLAKGEKVLMVKITERDSKGKVTKVYHEVVTDPDTIANYMNYEDGYQSDYEIPHSDEEYYYITTKSANNQALQGMLDRAFGKAPEKIEVEGSFFQVDNLTINVIPPRINAETEIEKIESTDGTSKSDVIDVEYEREASPSDQPS